MKASRMGITGAAAPALAAEGTAAGAGPTGPAGPKGPASLGTSYHAGTAELPAGSEPVAVTFTTAMPDDNYSVALTPGFAAILSGNTLQVAGKTPTGFYVVLTTPDGSNATVSTPIALDWIAIENN